MDVPIPEGALVRRRPWRLIIVAILGVIGLVLVLIALYFAFLRGGVAEQKPDASLPEVHGKVYFTGATTEDPALHTYAYDFDTNTFELAHSEFALPDYLHYTAAFSPSGERIAYFNALASTTTSPGELVTPYSRNHLVRFSVTDPETFDVRTTGTPAFKLYPAWSPDSGMIAYEAYTGGAEGAFANPNDWSVYIIGEEGEEERVAAGMSPQWSPDGTKLLYAWNDGIYAYDLSTEESVRVFEFLEFASWGSTRFDLSADGTVLALTPEAKRLERYEVTSWEPFTVQLAATANRQNVRHWYPQLSPDGTQVAVIDWEQVPSDIPADFRAMLSVYGTTAEGSLEHLESVPLDDFDLMAKYVSDWR